MAQIWGQLEPAGGDVQVYELIQDGPDSRSDEWRTVDDVPIYELIQHGPDIRSVGANSEWRSDLWKHPGYPRYHVCEPPMDCIQIYEPTQDGPNINSVGANSRLSTDLWIYPRRPRHQVSGSQQWLTYIFMNAPRMAQISGKWDIILWIRMRHICSITSGSVDSDNRLSPVWCQAIF